MTITETQKVVYVGHPAYTYTILENAGRKFGNRTTVITWNDGTTEIQSMTGNGKDKSFRHFGHAEFNGLTDKEAYDTAVNLFNHYFG